MSKRRKLTHHEDNEDTPAVNEQDRVKNNRAHLKSYVENAVEALQTWDTIALIACSPFAHSFSTKLQQSAVDMKRVRAAVTPEEIRSVLDRSFNMVHGASAFVYFSWIQIKESQVDLDETEWCRVFAIKTVYNARHPETQEEDVEINLDRLDLDCMSASFELHFTQNEFNMCIDMNDIDLSFVACACPAAREHVATLAHIYVDSHLPSALKDNTPMHSSFALLGNFPTNY